MIIQDNNIVLPTIEEWEKIVSLESLLDYEEYPRSYRLIGGLQLGDAFSYVSETYLNGYINYSDSYIGGFLIRRYTWCEEIYYGEDNGENRSEWNDACKYIDSLKDEYHSDFRGVNDDIFMLTKVNGDKELEIPDTYMFYWNDKDCSDCCIARIRCDEYVNDEAALDALFKYALGFVISYHSNVNYGDFLRLVKNGTCTVDQLIKFIPNNCFNGWINL